MKRTIFALLTAGLLALPVWIAQTPTRAEASVCAQTHLVQRGENLYRLAQRYNTSVGTLQLLNGISNPSRIFVGQSLCVRQANPDDTPVGGTRYIVQSGDRLSRIAQRFGVDMAVLARVNNITNPSRIYTGQVLTIPDATIQ
ncbi:MAG: LysM peptidoglycan-binding domain-containing protein [Anaerolineae bacterium]|nr:LysM peptidoglycan-binding domain-containing protein [Anaerolineae bacterium]